MASVDWAKLAREAEQGRRVLMYLNRLELRRAGGSSSMWQRLKDRPGVIGVGARQRAGCVTGWPDAASTTTSLVR
jgi:hypothetical protein